MPFVCPICNLITEKTGGICQNCGSIISQDKVSSIICCKCGFQNEMVTKSCAKCGNPYSVLCPECQKDVILGDEKCDTCGLSFNTYNMDYHKRLKEIYAKREKAKKREKIACGIAFLTLGIICLKVSIFLFLAGNILPIVPFVILLIPTLLLSYFCFSPKSKVGYSERSLDIRYPLNGRLNLKTLHGDIKDTSRDTKGQVYIKI